jgi:hypothetical protein
MALRRDWPIGAQGAAQIAAEADTFLSGLIAAAKG